MSRGNLPTTNQFAKLMDQRLQNKRENLAAMLPRHMDVDRFIDVARTAIVRKGDELRACDPDSVYLALRQCAAAGLLPDGDESAIIRYGEKAQWTPMIKGVIRQILRSPSVRSVITGVVRRGDDFEIVQGMDPDLRHRPTGEPPSEDDYDPTVQAAYAIVKFDDGRDPVVEEMKRPEIEKARKSSRAPDSPAWKRWYDEMARKSVLHRASKYVDLAPEARRLKRADIAANWEGETPVPEDADLDEQLAASAETDVAAIRDRITDGEPETETGTVEARSREEDREQEGPEDEERQEEQPGRRIYPDETDAPDGLPPTVGLWQETPGSGWYRPFAIERTSGSGVVEQKPAAAALLTAKNVRLDEAVDRARAWHEEEHAAGGEDEPGEPETETEPETDPETEERRAEQYRKMLSAMLDDEDFGVSRQMVIDAQDKLFGGSDDVPRTAAGFVDLGRLDAGRLKRLVEELLEESGEEAPDVSG